MIQNSLWPENLGPDREDQDKGTIRTAQKYKFLQAKVCLIPLKITTSLNFKKGTGHVTERVGEKHPHYVILKVALGLSKPYVLREGAVSEVLVVCGLP